MEAKLVFTQGEWVSAPLRCTDALFTHAAATGSTFDPEAALLAAFANPGDVCVVFFLRVSE